MPLYWSILLFVLGMLAGVLCLLPVTRILLRRGEQRARDAERRATGAERLAELGSMTSGLAHEIKNPLSTVGLNAQMLVEAIGDSSLPANERTRLIRRTESLSREAGRLRDILNDFLQFAGRIRLDPQPHELVEMIEKLGDFFHPQCEQAHVLLRLDLPGRPIVAPVDDGLLKQAILNLMINAVQAMSDFDGPRELIVRVEEDAEYARVEVIDTGPGIDPERLETIFHPYVSNKPGGTGLGLPTARRLIEEHGGRLSVESTPGSGTDFIILLPKEKPPETPQQS